MKAINTEELKQLQLSILLDVNQFCRENSINYWLDCGTLLGAIRHNGYIPWDDDIDIGMLRPDYEKFMASFNESTSRYVFKSIENDEGFLYPSGKVLDLETVLYEPDRNGQKLCVNIDVFVYDNAPDDTRKLNRMYDLRDLYRRLNKQRISTYKIKGSLSKIISGYSLRAILKFFPKNYFVKKMVLNSKKYSDIDSEYIGNFTSYSRILCEKSDVKDCIYHVFEGYDFPIPAGYDNWLTAFYKDYMILPPKEKQNPHHVFEAFYNND